MVEIFGTGDETVSFESVGVLKEFYAITSSLYKTNKLIESNYTKGDFIYEIVDLMRSLKKEQREATKQDWDTIVKTLLEKPDQELEIAVLIYGVSLQNNFIALGDFKVYKREQLLEKYPDIIKTKSSLTDSPFFVSKLEKGKSSAKCRENAEKNFFIFEN